MCAFAHLLALNGQQDTIQMVPPACDHPLSERPEYSRNPCPLLDLFSSIPEITKENEGTFNIVFQRFPQLL